MFFALLVAQAPHNYPRDAHSHMMFVPTAYYTSGTQDSCHCKSVAHEVLFQDGADRHNPPPVSGCISGRQGSCHKQTMAQVRAPEDSSLTWLCASQTVHSPVACGRPDAAPGSCSFCRLASLNAGCTALPSRGSGGGAVCWAVVLSACT